MCDTIHTYKAYTSYTDRMPRPRLLGLQQLLANRTFIDPQSDGKMPIVKARGLLGHGPCVIYYDGLNRKEYI